MFLLNFADECNDPQINRDWIKSKNELLSTHKNKMGSNHHALQAPCDGWKLIDSSVKFSFRKHNIAQNAMFRLPRHVCLAGKGNWVTIKQNKSVYICLPSHLAFFPPLHPHRALLCHKTWWQRRLVTVNIGARFLFHIAPVFSTPSLFIRCSSSCQADVMVWEEDWVDLSKWRR